MPRAFANWLQAYMQYTMPSEAPDKFHFWTGVSTIAGALRRQVWIDEGTFQWAPNFYIVFVAPPGIVSKTSTMNLGMRLLRRVPGVNFGPDVVTWQALVQSLAESTEAFTIDGTHYPMSAITIAAGEFGTFLNPQDREMVDAIVSLYDSTPGPWEKATKTQGVDTIDTPWVNMISCTTPSWIANSFPEYMIGGGFASRTIFVYGDTKRKVVAYPSKHLPPDFSEQGDKLVSDLVHMSKTLKGPYKLSLEAEDWGEMWYEEHVTKGPPPHLEGERFATYLSRKQTHIHKLSMILAASDGDELIIQRSHIEGAAQIVTANEYDMPKVFANVGKTDMTRAITEVVNFVQARQQITITDLYNLFRERLTWQEFEMVVLSAEKSGNISKKALGGQLVLQAVRSAV